MSGAPPAARLHDPVAHSNALGGFLAGAVVGLAAAAAAAVAISAVVGVVALEAGTAGLATPLVIGVVATVGEVGLNAVVGGFLMSKAEEIGESLGSKSMGPPSGKIMSASSNVLVNMIPAARVEDAQSCDAGKIAQGSSSVFVNGRPAARVGDKLTCGGAILSGSSNVFIGGATRTVLPVQSEVPEWVRWAAVVVGILPALGSAGRAIGPALAEIRAAGLSRAMQTGAKALRRAMEARAGSVRPPFAHEPMIPPGATVKTSNFSAVRPGGLDMANLSTADDIARQQLARGGWNPATQEQILNSGDNFVTVPGRAGQDMYGFSSKAYPKKSDSAYWTDQAGFDDLRARFYDPATRTWDSPGVKNAIALPCYNKADAVFRGTLGQNQTMVGSVTNPATETVTYLDRAGNELLKFQRTMPGGGGQIAPTNGSVGGIVEHIIP